MILNGALSMHGLWNVADVQMFSMFTDNLVMFKLVATEAFWNRCQLEPCFMFFVQLQIIIIFIQKLKLVFIVNIRGKFL